MSVYCENEPPAGGDGADETGGGGDGGPYNGNYWWETCVGFECSDPDVQCYEGLPFQYCKKYSFPDVESSFPGVPICVGDGTPAPVDIYDDWVAGGYPGIDTEIRSACSQKCEDQNAVNENVWTSQMPELAPVCSTSTWSPVSTGAWAPNDPENCGVVALLNEDDPDGSDIDWVLAGGSSTPLPLDCDLTDDCADWFIPNVRAFVFSPGEADIIVAETRSAHYLAFDDNDGTLEIDMPGKGAGVDDTEPLYGFAEYSGVDCGEDVCPFYLANLSASNTTDTWDITVDTPTTSLAKRIRRVHIDLLQSTLGVYNPSLDAVIFAPGSLRMRVQITVSCPGLCLSWGNGTHVGVVENAEYVVAGYVNGELTLDHTFDLQSGSATMQATLVPTDYPPVAVHDLSSSEDCDDADGLVLDADRSASTDPDVDIDFEYWWVDGEPCGHGCVISTGSHTVSLEVQDDRGAVDRTDEQTVTVERAGPCL